MLTLQLTGCSVSRLCSLSFSSVRHSTATRGKGGLWGWGEI